METVILASLALLALIVLAAILNMQRKILQEIKNIKIPKPPPPIEIPPAKDVVLDLTPVIEAIKNIHIPEQKEITFPKIEIPPAKEVVLNLNPVIEAIQNIHIPEQKEIAFPKIEIPPAKEVVLNLNPVIEAIKNIHIPEQKEIAFPKIEIPPAKEVTLDLSPLLEAVNKKETGITAELLQNAVNTQSELASLMRINQAEFQSGLEAFHKAIEKLLNQIPTSDKELDAQKEFMQKFEEAFIKVQEKAAEAVNENSLRLQEILTEVLNKEAK